MLRKVLTESLWIEKIALASTLVALCLKTGPAFWFIFMFIIMLDILFQTTYLLYKDFWSKVHRLKVEQRALYNIDNNYHRNICYRIIPDLKFLVTTKYTEVNETVYWFITITTEVVVMCASLNILRVVL